jgi:tRNA 2-selenouridine synthase
MQILEIADLIKKNQSIPLIDVRSEAEFSHGHIPGAINIPLLNNENRIKVGTLYKEKGNEAAVLLGYELVGPEFALIIRDIKSHCPGKNVIIHCWRGGLRSKIVAQLMENSGFEVNILKGGYKSFRRWALNLFEIELPLKVIGGLTGSGKTELLHSIENEGEQVIDLESIANHKGSAFGNINMPPQPSQEQFENNLAIAINKLDSTRGIWIEDESRMIGVNCVPEKIWETIRHNVLHEIEVEYEDRLQRIINEYGSLPVEKLKEKTSTLRKKLGDKRLQELLSFLDEGLIKNWSELMLAYYDENYSYGQSKRPVDTRKKIKMGKPDGKIFLDLLNQNV